MKMFTDPKFLTLLVDTIVSMVLYFAGKYASPTIFEDIKFVILLIQPIAIIVVVNLYRAETLAIQSGDVPKFLR